MSYSLVTFQNKKAAISVVSNIRIELCAAREFRIGAVVCLKPM